MNLQTLIDTYPTLGEKTTGFFTRFTLPYHQQMNPRAGLQPGGLGETPTEAFTAFAQETLLPLSTHEQAQDLWDVLSFLWFLTQPDMRTPPENTITYRGDTLPTKETIQQLAHQVETVSNKYYGDFPKLKENMKDQRYLFLHVQANTPNTPALLDVAAYYHHFITVKQVPLISDNTHMLPYIVEGVLARTNLKLAYNTISYLEHMLALFTDLFTTPTQNGRRVFNSEYMLNWEKHPNWELFMNTLQEPPREIVKHTHKPESLPVQDLAAKLPKTQAIQDLLWFLQTQPATAFINGYFQKRSMLDIMVLGHKISNVRIHATNYFKTLHRIFTQWAHHTDNTPDDKKADLTLFTLDVFEKLYSGGRNTFNTVTGNILRMTQDIPADVLELPTAVRDNILEPYLKHYSYRTITMKNI